MDKYERIENALQVLYDEGIKSYNEEYQKDIPRFRAIGMAIASVTRSRADVLRLAYEALEDWNYHSTCAVIDWICPSLHEGMEYLESLQRIKGQIDREVTVKTVWNNEAGDYETARYKVEVVLTKLEDEEEQELVAQ